MSGTLTINSNGDGSILSGHSWIEYTPDGGGESTTYGTWGNNPTGKGNGLFENLEKGRVGDAQRSVHITDEQEKALYAKIKEYKDKGAGAWEYLNPCSGFASDAWSAATGEDLSDRTFGISNPSKLKKSIDATNKADAENPEDKGKSSISSRRKVKDACQSCESKSSSSGSLGSSS